MKAGLDRARGICIVIDSDADNLYITVTARSTRRSKSSRAPGNNATRRLCATPAPMSDHS
jgi:hypothetical protein